MINFKQYRRKFVDGFVTTKLNLFIKNLYLKKISKNTNFLMIDYFISNNVHNWKVAEKKTILLFKRKYLVIILLFLLNLNSAKLPIIIELLNRIIHYYLITCTSQKA